jgi:hypothetical protein
MKLSGAGDAVAPIPLGGVQGGVRRGHQLGRRRTMLRVARHAERRADADALAIARGHGQPRDAAA